MIPKTIHLHWFSGEEYPKLINRCLRTWRKRLPDYTIRLWDANSFDYGSIPYVKEAWETRKWACVSDYLRLYCLYTEGGIYLDSDVEVLKTFDQYLDNQMFIGTEPYIVENEVKYDLEAAIMGAEAGHPFLKECMEYYENSHYMGKEQPTVCHIMADHLAKHGYMAENKYQKISNGVTVYPLDHYGNRYCYYDKTAIHWCQGSWLDYSEKSRLYYFCQRNGLMGFYHWLERIRGTRE